MSSSIQILEQIAEDVSKSGAQKTAALTAMQRLQDLTLQSERQDPKPIVESPGRAFPQLATDFVVFVLNGSGVTAEETQRMRNTLRGLASRGSLTVVTVGRMGIEIEAAKMAKSVGATHVEVGNVWQRPNPDGSTSRMPAARNIRNKTLRLMTEEYVKGSGTAVVLRYGREQSNDECEPLLVKAGALPRKGSSLYRPTEADDTPEGATS